MALAADTAMRDSQKLRVDNGATPVVAPHREKAKVQQISKDKTTRSRPTRRGSTIPHKGNLAHRESLNATGMVVSMTPPGVTSKTTNAKKKGHLAAICRKKKRANNSETEQAHRVEVAPSKKRSPSTPCIK